MEKEQKRDAKGHMMELMQAGHHWKEAGAVAGVQTSRSTAYRWWQAPQASSHLLQTQLEERFGFRISITHLNRLRAAHGRVQPARRKEKNPAPNSSSDSRLSRGGSRIAAGCGSQRNRMAGVFRTSHRNLCRRLPSSKTRSQLLLTLWLLSAVGLHRTSDLRSYTGDTHGWLTGRERAYKPI